MTRKDLSLSGTAAVEHAPGAAKNATTTRFDGAKPPRRPNYGPSARVGMMRGWRSTLMGL